MGSSFCNRVNDDIFWFAEVGDELAVIGEKSYSGYEAVQVNRKITKEFEGIITDEK